MHTIEYLSVQEVYVSLRVTLVRNQHFHLLLCRALS